MQDYPWFRSYDPGIPHTLAPYPEKTMIDFVDESAKARPYRTMLFFKGFRMSYDDFVRESDALSAALAGVGITKGDRVAMLLPNSPQMVLGFHAIWKAGAIACPLDPLYSEREIEHALKDIGASAVIVLNPFYETVKKAQPDSCKAVIATSIKEYLPPVLKTAFTLLKEKKEGYRITLKEGDYGFQYLLKKYKNVKRPQAVPELSDPAVLLFSGGTTGIPRGAIGTHQALVMTAMQIRGMLDPVIDEWDDRALLIAPLFLIFGCLGAMGTAIVNRSSCILIQDPSDFGEMVSGIRMYKPALLPGWPDLYSGILDHPLVKSGKVSLKSVKIGILEEGLVPEIKDRWEGLTGGLVKIVSVDPMIGEGKGIFNGEKLPEVLILKTF